MGEAQQPPQVLHRHVHSEVTNGQAPLVGSLPPGQRMNLSIVLPLRNQADLTSLLQRLYDPTSPDFRRFLTVGDFTQRFGPTAQDYQTAVAFAQANGFTVTGTPANRLVVPISGTVDQINSAFHVRLNVYRHPTENRTFYSPDREPSLNLSVSVAHIAGLNNFHLPHPMTAKPRLAQAVANVTGSGPGGSYLASDMRAAYYGGTTLDGNGQAVGLLEYSGYDLSDVASTFTNAGQTYNVPINNVLLDGMTGAPDSGGQEAEVVLDIVQAIGMAPGLSQVRVYMGTTDSDMLNAMASENIAKQISSSWMWTPDDPQTDDVFFQEFAAQGQSFFSASGDDGAWDASISPYFYPSEDQYVTAVGGTHLTTNGLGGAWASETAWNSSGNGSGGGISPDSIAIPGWQGGLANSSNAGSTSLRNVPDVAMEGDFDNYVCSLGNCDGGWAGTSFAAPRWAGFMALVNQQAVEAGSAPQGGIGFLNPALYILAEGPTYGNDLHDITSGNNDTENQPLWFNAVTGYDLVTGWGSANGQHLIDDLAGPQVPGFWILATPSTLSLNLGASTSTTVNVTDAGGFTGNVTLAVTTPLPSGVTASWGTNPTSESSVLTLTASSNATGGTYTLNITGTAGSLTKTTTVALSVHAPSFLLSAAPTSLGLNQSSSATSTISVSPQYGFTGAVNLSLSGLPSGVTATFSPTSTSSTSTLTVTASNTAGAGTSTLTISGASGALTNNVTLPLSVHAPSFLVEGPSYLNIGQGTSSTFDFSVVPQYGFNGTVNLTVSGLPTGVTASFSPNPTANGSVLTLTASSTAVTGNSTLTITGTSGALTSTMTLTLGVNSPSFTLSPLGVLNLGQGASGNVYVGVTAQNGFAGNVTFSVSGLPSGVTALWNPNPTTGTSSLTLTTTSSAVPGTTTLTITGTSGYLKATTTLSLSVQAPNFTVSGPGYVSLGQGTTGSGLISIYPLYGFTGKVNLSVSGLPSGVTASFSPNPTTGFSTLTLNASGSVPTGTSTVTVTATSGNVTASTTFTLAIFTPSFSLFTSSLNIGQGSSGVTPVSVYQQYGFSSKVNLSVSGLPTGVTASFATNPTSSSSALTLTVAPTAPLGQYTLTVTGISGTQTATSTVALGIFAPGFTLLNPGSVALAPGSSTSTTINASPQYGFAGNVSLSVSGLPSGVTASFNPNSTPSASVLTLTASSTAALGQYPLTITGSSGSETATTPLALTIATPSFSLSAGPVSVGQGASATDYVSILPQNGFAGNVNLSLSGLPSGVTASFNLNPATSGTYMTIVAGATAATGQYTLALTGTSGSQTVTTTLTLDVNMSGFILFPSASTVSMNPGGSATASISVVSQWGFTGNVNLVASGLPNGVTATFSPNPSANGTSTLTLSAADTTAAPGIAIVTITGSSGSLTSSTAITLTINTPKFTIIDAPGRMNLSPGGSGQSTVVVIPQNGFNASINLAAGGLPDGVTATFSPSSTGQSSILTLTASNSAPLGAATVTIAGVSGSETATAPLVLSIGTAPPSTSTTLQVSAGGNPVTTVATGTVVTLMATVSGGSPDLAGQINFCDATSTSCDQLHLLGSAQLNNAGTATLKFVPGMGSHSYKAVFAGTAGDSGSSSAASNLTVTASQPSTTTIAQSGGPSNYTLTATVTGQGAVAPGGTVSFLDTSSANSVLGVAALANRTVTSLQWKSLQSPPTGAQPDSIAVADFNQDGIVDLAVANLAGNSVTILLGNGDGTFTATAASPQTGNQPLCLVAGDFNRDGKPDLAVANLADNNLTILLGNGDGTFTAAPNDPETGSEPNSIVVGDMNGDGLLDLAVLNAGMNTVTVLLGNGDGSFTPSPLSAQTGSQPRSLLSADFNGDGNLDLATVNSDGSTLTILLGNGDGSFTPAPSPATSSQPLAAAVGDFNLDGKPDLAVVNGQGSPVSILLGNGDGTFTPAATSPSAGSNAVFLSVADLNKDGNPDLIAVNQRNEQIAVLLGNGDGTFGSASNLASGAYPDWVAVGDFNGDGVDDLSVANYSANSLSVLAGELTQTATATVTGISPAGSGAHAIEASYPGDTSYQPSTSASTQLTAELITPTVTVTPSSLTVSPAQSLTVTVTVSGGSGHPAPTGSVTLTSGSYTAQQTLAAGATTFNLAAGSLPVGSNPLNASYSPDTSGATTYAAASGSANITVSQATATKPATITATPSAQTITDAQSVQISVSVSGTSGQPTPTGTVSLSGGDHAQQAISNGTTTFTIAPGTLPGGTNTLTATYSGDAIYSPANTTTVVTVATFALSVTPISAISSGSSATGSITLTAGSSYSGTMNLACALTASPTGAQNLPTCNITPGSINLSAGGTGTAVLSVNTASSSASARLNFWRLGGGGSVLAALLLFVVPLRRPRWTSALAVLLLLAAVGMTGCGGSGNQPPAQTTSTTTTTTTTTSATSTAGAYTFTITATDAANAKLATSTNLTVTVH
jgi:hypothetical protein